MTYQAVEDAIRTRFNTLITKSATAPITTIFENQNEKPPTQGKWIRLGIQPGETEQVSLGNKKRFRLFGLVVAQIYDEIGRGTKNINVVVNSINTSGVFRSVSVGGVVYRTPSILKIGRVDNWYQVNVLIPFYSDDIEV